MSADRLSTTFAALSDPTRRAILARLSTGELSVKELAEPFKMSMPGISKHLKVLEHAGLIARGRDAQWRPCRLEAAPIKEATEWMDQYRKFWEERFDRLEEYLQTLQGENENSRTRELENKAAPEIKKSSSNTPTKRSRKQSKEKGNGTRNS